MPISMRVMSRKVRVAHMLAAKAIAKGNVELAVKASHGLMDYLVTFASEVMGKK